MLLAENSDESNLLLELKRKIYLAIVPILAPALILSWYFAPPDHDPLMLASPIIAAITTIGALFMYKRKFMRITELVILAIFSLLHLTRIFILTDYLDTGQQVNLYLLWAPLNYIFIFMALNGKKALAFSLYLYITTFIIVLEHFSASQFETQVASQIIFSHIIYILVLYFFQRMMAAYNEAHMLRKFAYQDVLTKIGNRRMLDEIIGNQVKSSAENNSIFSLIYFDIDHFKQINDVHGHEVGDNVLKDVAALVQHNIRDTDYFGRWGGEEFIIVLTNQSAEKAFEQAERLRMIIQHHLFQEVGTVTASFGIATVAENDQPRTLLWRADLALYEAKSSGRNTVKVHVVE